MCVGYDWLADSRGPSLKYQSSTGFSCHKVTPKSVTGHLIQVQRHPGS